MKISNMHKIYVYSKETKKIDGESTIKWKYKNYFYLNDQQDINELDKTSSGIVDFDTLKLRTNRGVNMVKTDGISIYALPLDDDSYVKEDKPQYTIESSNIIGKSILYICKTYNGE